MNYKLSAHESVFIDDLEINVRAAKDLGIDGIVCRNPSQVRAELQIRKIVDWLNHLTDDFKDIFLKVRQF